MRSRRGSPRPTRPDRRRRDLELHAVAAQRRGRPGQRGARPPVDCTTDPRGRIAVAKAKATSQIGRCTDTTGMFGCLIAAGADPHCLGVAAVQIGIDLVDTVFGTD